MYRLSDVHERFLAAPGLRLVPDASIVKQTVLKAVEQGKTVIKSSDGTAYDKVGAVQGPEGQRRRVEGETPTIGLRENEFITRVDSAAAREWLSVSTAETHKGDDGPKTPPIEAARVIATNWQDILKHAETRPILDLRLDASTPTGADTLAALAQPLGADTLTLDVTVSGDLKSGGSASFAVSEAKLTSPIKPLESARTLFNAMQEGMSYGAQLRLIFKDPGRPGMKSNLEAASEEADDDVKPSATFGKVSGQGGKK